MKTAIIHNRSFLGDGYRIDPDIHLSEGVAVRKKLRSLPYELSTVGENTEKVFLGNIFSRVFVKDKEHGMPYLAASDTVLSNIDTGKYLSHKQCKDLNYLILHKDWILVTCSGTLGNVTYTNSVFENHIATHDLIRIIPNSNKVNAGTLYAFLASKYGYYQITQSQFGGVVKHINDDQAKSIIVPVFPATFQDTVSNIVLKSSRLREAAKMNLDKAHSLIESFLKIPDIRMGNAGAVKSIAIVSSHTHRLESSYYISSNRTICDYIKRNFQCSTLKELSDNIFRPGIFKRQYVNNGVPFLGGADIMLATPKSDKTLSFRQVDSMPELLVNEGWILITCGGTIGNCVLVDKQLSKCAISQHVLRIKPKNPLLGGLLYAYLSSKVGYELITLYAYGSVIPQVEPHHIERIPVPTFPPELTEEIVKIMAEYSQELNEAKELELKAISLLESKIEE